MFLFCLILSLVVFFIFCLIGVFSRKKKVKAMGIVVTGIIIATAILVFPLNLNGDIIRALLLSAFFGLKIPALSTNFSMLDNAILYSEWYKYTLYLYTFLAPLLTAGVVISFISRMLNEFRLNINSRQIIHIFSNLNERSLILAESLKSKNCKIVFCNVGNRDLYFERVKSLRAILLKKTISEIQHSKYKEVNFYVMSDDEDENVNEALTVINQNKDCSNTIKLFVFANSEESRIILNSTDKKNVKTMIVNSNRQLVYDFLSKNPLYNYCNNQISALMIGGGAIGIEFLKAISWTGQMIDKELDIKVVDKNASKIESKILFECPELKVPFYNISFYQMDVFSKCFGEFIESFGSNANYIIVSLGSDDSNLKAAIQLRQYYSKYNMHPMIAVNIKNKEKKLQINKLCNSKGDAYDLHPFGTIDELYCFETIINNVLEIRAQKIHLTYNPKDTDLNDYYSNEYNRQSSLASALHLQYKQAYVNKMWNDYDGRKFDVLNDNEVRNVLAENEHNRWMAYLRTQGYCSASIDDVKQYMPLIKNHINHIAKLHPCLFDYNQLEELSEKIAMIAKENNIDKEYDFVKSDVDIIVNMLQILKDE